MEMDLAKVGRFFSLDMLEMFVVGRGGAQPRGYNLHQAQGGFGL